MSAGSPVFKPWITVSLDAVVDNLNFLRHTLPPSTGIMAVVKDNAYGCGAVPVARTLEKAGAAWLVVARIEEATALRRGGIKLPVLVLGTATADEIIEAAGHNISFSLNDLAQLEQWQSIDTPFSIHCNVDTGMGRLGIVPEEMPKLIAALQRTPRAHLDGMYTHFANADRESSAALTTQYDVFAKALQYLREHGIQPRCVHTDNSAAAALHPPSRHALVRCGILLYGGRASDAPAWAGLNPVVTLSAPVMKVKHVAAGTPVGYGSSYRTPRPAKIATIPVGYAHGYPRLLSNRGAVLIGGTRYRVAGRVTMDYLCVDLGPDSTVHPGDKAVVLGSSGPETVTVDDIARQCNTIGYEILCGLSPAVERSYFYQGREIELVSGALY